MLQKELAKRLKARYDTKMDGNYMVAMPRMQSLGQYKR